MKRTEHRKQLALFLCCGFAGVIVGGYATEAAAQSPAPLRVDPVLLGLPPLPPPEPAAKAPTPAQAPAQAQTGGAEVRPVESQTVEARPLQTPASTENAPAPARAAAPVVASPRPVVAPPAAVSVQLKPAPARPVDGPKMTILEPLRVDPALLGLPSLPTQAAGTPRPDTPAQPSFAIADRREDEAAPDQGPALSLRSSSRMATLPKDSAQPRPVFLSAHRLSGEINREMTAEGDAELRKYGTVVNADSLTYRPLEDELEGQGNVRLQQGEDHVSGPRLRLRLEDQVGYFDQPSYYMRRQSQTAAERARDREASDQRLRAAAGGMSWLESGFEVPRQMSIAPGQTVLKNKIQMSTTNEARGEAERLDFEGENQFRLKNNRFTMCPVDNDSWYVTAKEMKLDYDREVGEGKSTTVYFKDVPIFYSPWLSFSLNNERKSGFLSPSVVTSSDNGFEYEQPYYWNIAPNMDATLSPRYMTRRGLQLKNEFRYLNTAWGGVYTGKLEYELLPTDRLRNGDRRTGIGFEHTQTTANGFTGVVRYNRVSDNDYYTDLSSDVARTSQTQLLQQAMLSYGGGGWWNTSINFQQYQTIQPDVTTPVLDQYRMLPQITFNARKPDLYRADLSFLGQYTNFTMARREQLGTNTPDGRRLVLYPQIALPYTTPGWYVTPKFGVNYRSYSLTGQADTVPGSMSVSLPIFSVDSGMTFERDSQWFGRNYTQTLEPRLYYVNIPYRDQSKIPVFDSGLADFNFAQIFSENQFSSWDRINNANQVTAAVTSRLIEPNSGNEIMRAMLGQRFYFTRNRVALSGAAVTNTTEKWDRSDVLAAFSGQVLPKVYFDAATQYDIADQRIDRYALGLRYRPESGKVFNVSYRYNRDVTAPLNQVDVSGQWPLGGGWHAVGRVNYSFKDDGTVLSTGGNGGRVIESIAGLEYNGGCWILRGVLRRQALTSSDASTAFFLQLELSGLGRVGSNPLGLLKRNIQGYSGIGNPDSVSVFDD